ncbi:titin [Tribolium castaneum]|uniref:SH2 domain-containing protein n=1 Tax=Tribolium castaneum TaxID=7070 RepID=D6WAB5_TRICA|nr:PREDICTED: titin [Tribolium castaneum]EEZ98032.2 hypothetical protein TcasGA2_TC000433 [Tribolium castaneum]|eukprot:XP_008201564.1 PREDICTED: titin [Tribolium castaneum]
MSNHKYLNFIQQFNQDDVIQMFKDNGYSELEEVLIKMNIKDGKELLNLTELDMIKWKLEVAVKRKLWSFVTKLKENPGNYLQLPQEKPKPPNLIRRQSIRHEKSNFVEKLEQVIYMNSPETQNKQKPLVPPKRPSVNKVAEENEFSSQETPQTENVCEQLPTPKFSETVILDDKTDSQQENKSKQLPIPPKKLVVHEKEFSDASKKTDFEKSPQKENKCKQLPTPPKKLPELKPPEKAFIEVEKESPVEEYVPMDIYDESGYLKPSTQFRQNSISQRPPLALPRESTTVDYINGPTNKSAVDEPPPLLPRAKENNRKKSEQTQIMSEPEEITYEAVEETTPQVTVPQKPSNYELLTNKLFGLFKTNKKNPNECNTNSLERSRKNSESSPKPERRLQNRPLPAVPKRAEEFTENTQIQTRKTVYIETKAPDQVPSRSKSENNLLSSEEEATYGNAEVEEPKPKPDSYEHFCLTGGLKIVPSPNNLPHGPLNPAELRDNSESEGDEGEEYGNYVFNINDEPFYRNTDRRGAKQLLQNLANGAFLIRPSRKYFLSLTLKHNGRYFNLGIEKGPNNKIRLNTENESMSPEFATLKDFVEYFSREQLTFQHQGRTVALLLKKILPPEVF